MSERWKPEIGEEYWIVNNHANIPRLFWKNDLLDQQFYEIGNCFRTRKEAESAAEKVKALLLSLHDEPVTNCNQLPKLTVDVFNRPDCPEWARYAAVDAACLAYWYQYPPIADERVGAWTYLNNKRKLIDQYFNRSDWQNSLVARPAKLPDWCKVGEWVE